MGHLIQVVKLACVGVFWGLVLGHWWHPFYGLLVGLLVFYFLLVGFTGTRRNAVTLPEPPQEQ